MLTIVSNGWYLLELLLAIGGGGDGVSDDGATYDGDEGEDYETDPLPPRQRSAVNLPVVEQIEVILCIFTISICAIASPYRTHRTYFSNQILPNVVLN